MQLERIVGTNRLINRLTVQLVTRGIDRLRETRSSIPSPVTRHQHPQWCVVIELDGLKRIIDRSGHGAGDAALVDHR